MWRHMGAGCHPALLSALETLANLCRVHGGLLFFAVKARFCFLLFVYQLGLDFRMLMIDVGVLLSHAHVTSNHNDIMFWHVMKQQGSCISPAASHYKRVIISLNNLL